MNMLAPRVPTRNIGSRLWIISEETSMSRLTKPSTQTPVGMLRSVPLGLSAMPHCGHWDYPCAGLFAPRQANTPNWTDTLPIVYKRCLTPHI